MGREIRRVPENWQHPEEVMSSGIKKFKYTPLNEDYIGSLEYYRKEVDEFIARMTEIIEKGVITVYDQTFDRPADLYGYLTDDGDILPPNIEKYMPSGDWYQLYENVSEGTPLSPPFSTKEELVDWMATNKDFWDHTWTREQAEAMVNAGYAMSGVYANGRMYTSEESVLLK